MGTVAVTYRIMPEGVETDLGELERRVRAAVGDHLLGLQVKPIAFGLSALQATAGVEDGSDDAATLEAALADLPGVESVEVVDVTLI